MPGYAPHIIPEAATHIHIGHELEPIPDPIYVTPDGQEKLPF